MKVETISERGAIAMSEKSIGFEQRVERIHRLLEGDDAVVTWNDRIPDPDNPTLATTDRRNDPSPGKLHDCRVSYPQRSPGRKMD